MPANKEITSYSNKLLAIDKFNDYCPNGMQIEGKKNIKKIITAVSVNLELINKAIAAKTDLILVHHGIFWENDNKSITGPLRNKIALLLKNNINLIAYHLPLDAHPKLGNNIELARILNIKNASPIGDTLIWQGEFENKMSLDDLSMLITNRLNRKPLIFSPKDKIVKKIAWCSGAAQNYIDKIIDMDFDAYLSGEVSERIPHLAVENNVAYISAGHYATEKYGVQALGKHLSAKFNIEHEFIDIYNIV